jgi:hypothetical protein
MEEEEEEEDNDDELEVTTTVLVCNENLDSNSSLDVKINHFNSVVPTSPLAFGDTLRVNVLYLKERRMTRCGSNCVNSVVAYCVRGMFSW